MTFLKVSEAALEGRELDSRPGLSGWQPSGRCAWWRGKPQSQGSESAPRLAFLQWLPLCSRARSAVTPVGARPLAACPREPRGGHHTRCSLPPSRQLLPPTSPTGAVPPGLCAAPHPEPGPPVRFVASVAPLGISIRIWGRNGMNVPKTEINIPSALRKGGVGAESQGSEGPEPVFPGRAMSPGWQPRRE